MESYQAIKLLFDGKYKVAHPNLFSFMFYLLCRLLRVDLIKGPNVRPPVRTSIRPSTKSFFDFNETLACIGRGWRVMHDGMQHVPI